MILNLIERECVAMPSVPAYPIGMLDRDQRTAKLRYNKPRCYCCSNQNSCSCNSSSSNTNCNSCDIGVVERRLDPKIDSSTSTTISTADSAPIRRLYRRRNGHLWRSLLRLKNVVIACVYLSVVTFPSILTAPTNRSSDSNMSVTSPEWWAEPCGQEYEVGSAPSTDAEVQERLTTIRENIIHAEDFARRFINEFNHDIKTLKCLAEVKDRNDVQKTFNSDTDTHHELWKSCRYDWLPKIPKELGQNVSDDHLNSLKMEETLVDIYHSLQIFGVALEQVIKDEKSTGGSFTSQFEDCRNRLKLSLCYIQLLIKFDLQLTPKPDVRADVITSSINQGDTSEINMRNWLIYRDYLNMIEYVKEVINHFISERGSQTASP